MSKRQRRMNKRGRRYHRRGFLTGAVAVGTAAWKLLGHNAIWDGVKWVGTKGIDSHAEPRVVAADVSCSPAINVGIVAIVAEGGSLSVIGG
jgi:hypothetical protein